MTKGENVDLVSLRIDAIKRDIAGITEWNDQFTQRMVAWIRPADQRRLFQLQKRPLDCSGRPN